MIEPQAAMTTKTDQSDIYLEIAYPGRAVQTVGIEPVPFLIGRGEENGNHLILDDRRISRSCAAIVQDDSGYHVEDRGHRQGVYVNGRIIKRQKLKDGDKVSFGLDDSYELTFHSSAVDEAIVESMLTRLTFTPTVETTQPISGLAKLNVLLEATSLLQSQLPVDSVLGTMLDHAITLMHADRGLLLEPEEALGNVQAPVTAASLNIRIARASGGKSLEPSEIKPTQTALQQALEKQSAIITEDLNLAELNLQSAQSVVLQGLRSIVAIPLYALPRANSMESIVLTRGQLLGVLYLDSRRTAAFSMLDRQLLDALGAQAASILDNARLVERERQRQRLEQELAIAREIQQALVPQGLKDFPHLAVSGLHLPCQAVGGDYYDVFTMLDGRTAFLIADVSGKGLGAALLTTMLQGALSGMALGSEPVKVLNHINRFLCEHAVVGRYATLFFGLIDSEGNFEYIRAGHPSPLLLRKSKVTDLYTGGSFPVGLIDDAEFSSTRTKLEPGDTLLLFSDGVTEAENKAKELYGFDRLRQLLAKQDSIALDTLKSTLLHDISLFSSGAAQSDDITLLTVRYRTPVAQGPKKNPETTLKKI
jgi:serine phosphatase RsbU (regulator of sigma subunit)